MNNELSNAELTQITGGLLDYDLTNIGGYNLTDITSCGNFAQLFQTGADALVSSVDAENTGAWSASLMALAQPLMVGLTAGANKVSSMG